MEVTDHLVYALGKVLTLSGARGVSGSSTWGDKFREKVVEVVEQSMVIRRAVGEDVSSSDLEIICPHHGSAFIAEEMQDIDDCGRKKLQETSEHRRVLCTTEIGLRRRERVASEKGRSEMHTVILVKAKVALGSDPA